MIRRLDPDRLENILSAFYKPTNLGPIPFMERLFADRSKTQREDD
jgi:hypothetical protein